jgi:hypothetical protein
MTTDSIAEVGIDEQERLYIRPSTATFPFIYREAVEVHWDPIERFLFSPPPRDWTYLHWFQHIIDTAGILFLTPVTIWTNVPDEMRVAMQDWFATRSPHPPA